MENIIVSRWNTAITNGISGSAKLLILDYKKNEKILDYGCGKLRNTKNLLNNGIKNINITDLPTQLERIIPKIVGSEFEDRIDIHTKEELKKLYGKMNRILCSFVINTIENIEERNLVLEEIYNLLKVGGTAYIEVRMDKLEILKYCKNITEFSDGWLMQRKGFCTFNKAYEKEEFLEFIESSSFGKNYTFKRGNRSFIGILRKEV